MLLSEKMPRVTKKPRNVRTTKEEIGSLTSPVKFLDQDYQELLQNCLVNKTNFVDEKFPSDRSSIDPWKKLELNQSRIKWLRPSVSYLHLRPVQNKFYLML